MKIWTLFLLFACSASTVISEDKLVDNNTVKALMEKARAGDIDAIDEVAHYYLIGFVLPKDPKKAEILFRVVADQTRPIAGLDKPAALLRMGTTLRILASLSEKRGDKNAAKPMLAEAFDWLRKAALCGVAPAQVMLAEAHLRGDQVPKDEIEGYAWEMVAARYHTDPGMKSELDLAVVNDSQRADPSVWAKAQKLSEQLIAKIEVAKGSSR